MELIKPWGLNRGFTIVLSYGDVHYTKLSQFAQMRTWLICEVLKKSFVGIR